MQQRNTIRKITCYLPLTNNTVRAPYRNLQTKMDVQF